MRLTTLLSIAALAVLPAAAYAQTAPNPPPPPGPGGHPPPPPMWQHGDWEGGWHHDGMGERGPAMLMKFYAANTTHDGHLTLSQAKAADMKMIVEHFQQIDVAKHGYVTPYDIDAWHLDNMAKHLEKKADELRAKD
jgi:Spy/CpxP family protein refolding chaperone